MKTIITVILCLAFVTTSAWAADPTVRHLEFNPKKNAYTVELTEGTPRTFGSGELVIKLDSATKTPYLKKGNHLHYVIFPNFEEMLKISNDMKP